MFKTLVILVICSLASTAFAARPCKVYGISDSPQKLSCHFPERHVQVSCEDGMYYLDRTPVTVAFHLEVESGTVPLVFKTPEATLTVVLGGSGGAELLENKTEITGTCKRI